MFTREGNFETVKNLDVKMNYVAEHHSKKPTKNVLRYDIKLANVSNQQKLEPKTSFKKVEWLKENWMVEKEITKIKTLKSLERTTKLKTK